MTAARMIVACATVFLVFGTGAQGADGKGADGSCASLGDSGSVRDAKPSEVQVLWSRKSLTYANTTDFYAACSYMVGRSGSGEKVETYLRPGQSVTRRGVSGIVSNPADCTIYKMPPCDAGDRWDG